MPLSADSDVIMMTEKAVATITINRPDVLNALTVRAMIDLNTAFQEAADAPGIGVIVITGAGKRAFCAGGDVNDESEDVFGGGANTMDGQMMALYDRFRNCPKPVIAKVRGYAIGGGNHLAYMTDFTIASSDAIFGQNGPRVASPAQGWLVGTLASVVGLKRAKEMWMMCRRYTAHQAMEWGLVNSVVPAAQLDAEVRQWCDELLSLSPTVVGMVKRSMDEMVTPSRDHLDGLDVQKMINPDFFDSGEQSEGAGAFVEKRTPDFSQWRASISATTRGEADSGTHA